MRKAHLRVTEPHVKFYERQKFTTLGIPYRSWEFEVEMLEEASCERTHCCKLCVAPNSRTKTAMPFPASAADFIFFTDELVWKLVDDIMNTWPDRLLLCFAVRYNFSIGFCCVMFMSTVAALGVFSAWVTIKYHASIYNLKCVFCCKFPLLQYYWKFLRLIKTHRVIAK